MAEDRPDVRDLFVEYLTAAGYRANGVADRDQLRAAVTTARVDLIVADLSVVGPDVRALRDLAGRGAEPRLVAVTGRPPDGTETGFDAYLVKPVFPAELLDVVDRLLLAA